MNGELTLTGQCILIAMAILYSATLFIIGRRVNYPASLAAYGAAISALVAFPLLAEYNLHLVDQVVQIDGVSLLLCHLAFMVLFGGLLLLVVLQADQWSRRHQFAIGGSCFLIAIFVVLWLYVKTLEFPNTELVFHGIRVGHPPSVLWMNVSMGFGLLYISAWNLVEFTNFLRGARTTYEQVLTIVSIVVYALSGLAGTLTMTEAVGDHIGLDMTIVARSKASMTLIVIAIAVGTMVGQLWLRPLWRHRRQLLLRYVEPELVQLRNDLLNLSAAEAELHLDIHHETYANRAIVEAVATRCRAARISPARIAIARMAASLITFHRDNIIQDPSYGTVTSWDGLIEEAASEIDQMIASTSWEKALRDSYVTQQVYIVMFLVLDSREYREILLIDERPEIQPWHESVADIVATVMHEHGQSTPRYGAIASG
jgi:hypothetical protein